MDDISNQHKGGDGLFILGSAVTVIVAVAVLFLIGLYFFATDKVPRDKIGLSYGGGMFEGAHFQKLVPGGTGLFINGWGDRLYEYPTTQRNYIITKQEGEGDLERQDFIAAPSKDNIEVDYEVAVYFKLNTSLIREFHENIGLKYHAWSEDGWDKMLLDTFRPQIDFAIQRESRKYDVSDIYSNLDTLLSIQGDVGTVLKENINNVLGDDYFCGPSYIQGSSTCPDFKFVIKRITIPASVKTAFEDNRTSQIEILTRENEVTQAKKEAEAIEARQAALESCGQTCILYEAIQSGKITFWVIPDNQNLTLPTQGGVPAG